jgi:hypothetical protein
MELFLPVAWYSIVYEKTRQIAALSVIQSLERVLSR